MKVCLDTYSLLRLGSSTMVSTLIYLHYYLAETCPTACATLVQAAISTCPL